MGVGALSKGSGGGGRGGYRGVCRGLMVHFPGLYKN